MNREQARMLFEALAKVMSPLERTCEKALDTIRDDDLISERERETVKDAVKELLSGSLELKIYLRKHYPEFDTIGEGEKLWKQLRDQYDNGK
jgi:peptide subunit release factor 1 (eRF1)